MTNETTNPCDFVTKMHADSNSQNFRFMSLDDLTNRVELDRNGAFKYALIRFQISPTAGALIHSCSFFYRRLSIRSKICRGSNEEKDSCSIGLKRGFIADKDRSGIHAWWSRDQCWRSTTTTTTTFQEPLWTVSLGSDVGTISRDRICFHVWFSRYLWRFHWIPTLQSASVGHNLSSRCDCHHGRL